MSSEGGSSVGSSGALADGAVSSLAISGPSATASQAEYAPVESLSAAPLRFVCLGGGTGLPVVLRGLLRSAVGRRARSRPSVTAIVTMSDDGGSSGRLRRSRGSLPPGDVRRCLVALARDNPELSRVFQYRFDGTSGLAGHAVGNLLLTAMAELKGSFLEAIKLCAELLGVRDCVLPSTVSPVELIAFKANDTCVVGERNIARIPGRVLKVSLHPRAPPPADSVLESIEAADLISIGPGSLYSSVLPNLLVDGVAGALKRARAPKVLIANLMTQPGETDGMDCADHLRAIIDHIGEALDAVLVNSAPLPAQALERYAARGAFPVSCDRASVMKTGVACLEADLRRDGPHIRHDGRKLARQLMKIARLGL